jgi:hypothetical protein
MVSALIGYRAGGLVAKAPGEVRASVTGCREAASLLIIMRTLTVPQSGKKGATVSVLTRYGQVEREFVIPKDPHTPDQLRVRSNLGRIASRWRYLTPQQRIAWTLAGQDDRSRPCLGKSARLTGCQLFIKINCARAAIGLGQLSDPPPAPNFDENPVGELSITDTQGSVSLKLSVPATQKADIYVYGAAPCSAGITFVRDFVMLGRLPDPVGQVSEITDMYVARYGVPPAGMQVCIRTRQQVNGWEDIAKQTSAIVPLA